MVATWRLTDTSVTDKDLTEVRETSRILTDADSEFADGVYSTIQWLFYGGPKPDLLQHLIDAPVERGIQQRTASLMRRANSGDQGAASELLALRHVVGQAATQAALHPGEACH